MELDEALKLFKLDLGVSHDKRDALFTRRIESTLGELKGRGCNLDLTKTEDLTFVVDYTLWQYRKRETEAGLAPSLNQRLRNYQAKNRIGGGTDG